MKSWMKQLLCFSMLVLLNSTAVAQGLADQLVGHWQTDQLVGVFKGSPVHDQYTLARPDYKGEHVYGNNLVLEKNGQFRSFYQPQCGMDCWGSASGSYQMIGRDKIRLMIRETEMVGLVCGDRLQPRASVGIDMGVFLIRKAADGFMLLRTEAE